jgi:uracil-DNA glycosylase
MKHNSAATAMFTGKASKTLPNWLKKRSISFINDEIIDNEFSHDAFNSARNTYESEGNVNIRIC